MISAPSECLAPNVVCNKLNFFANCHSGDTEPIANTNTTMCRQCIFHVRLNFELSELVLWFDSGSILHIRCSLRYAKFRILAVCYQTAQFWEKTKHLPVGVDFIDLFSRSCLCVVKHRAFRLLGSTLTEVFLALKHVIAHVMYRLLCKINTR